MSSPEQQESKPPGFRARRRHAKSRLGCLECKRRRIKCDEMKPSCTRCVVTLKKCAYPSVTPTDADYQSHTMTMSLPSPSNTDSSSSPGTTSISDTPILTGLFTQSILTSSDTLPFSDHTHGNVRISDADLYHHFLQHTCRTLTHSHKDQNAMQIGMPTLALQSKTVFSACLAASAVCLCCDMIAKEPARNVETVIQIIVTGYRHYNVASERMRDAMSQPEIKNPETLLATAVLLVPFASASQQINHWISTRTESLEWQKLLCCTPRDVIVIMRGIKTTLEALYQIGSCIDPDLEPEMTEIEDNISSLAEYDITSGVSASGREHAMFPIITATNEAAFSTLRDRIGAVSFDSPRDQDALLACATAFEVLNDIRLRTFDPSNSTPLENNMKKWLNFTHVNPWLRAYLEDTSKHAIPQPGEPLTKPFLAFLVQAPKAYLDLVVPLLDQRLEQPTFMLQDDLSRDMTTVQALALDIYAHWSVLMFLAEYESWWIGTLPFVTLEGMVNRYGDDFVARLWPDYGSLQTQWWPGSMLNISREMRRFQKY